MDSQTTQDMIDQLKNKEEINVSVSKKSKEKKPPYTIVGSGFATNDFPKDKVVDAFKIVGLLNASQLKIFLYFRDQLIQKQLEQRKSKFKDEHPNTVILSKSTNDTEADKIKDLLSSNANGKKLADLGIIKKIANGKYMLNPYILIPAEEFSKVANEWESI